MSKRKARACAEQHVHEAVSQLPPETSPKEYRAVQRKAAKQAERLHASGSLSCGGGSSGGSTWGGGKSWR